MTDSPERNPRFEDVRYAINTAKIGDEVKRGIDERSKALDILDWHEVYRISGAIAHIANQLEEFDRQMYLRHTRTEGG